MMRSPSQWPGTSRICTSTGLWSIKVLSGMDQLRLLLPRAGLRALCLREQVQQAGASCPRGCMQTVRCR